MANKLGKPLKYGEPTKLVPFRLPISKITEIKKDIKKLLLKYV